MAEDIMSLADANKKRLAEIKRKLLETIDLTTSPEEQERRKREVEQAFTEEDFTEPEEEEAEKEPENPSSQEVGT